ncbi:hypothetical protein H6503_01680 [Candidatus Woesearchaeota archaeon]|nr:hypothetical protein [Candidatus Woesearchaeota archaeon]
MPRIDFDKRIYTAEAIEKAASDYSEAATITIKETDKSFEVDIDSEKHPKNIEHEFGNYVMGLML